MQKLPKFPEELTLAASLKTPRALETYERLRIGVEIKKMRLRKNMTQKQLAYGVGTSQSVIARIETGKQNLSLQTLAKLSFVLGKKLHVQFY